MLNAVESRCLAEFHSGSELDWSEGNHLHRTDKWIRFGLHLLLEAGRMIRGAQADLSQLQATLKEDGSPTTEVEMQIEALLQSRLTTFAPSATVVGEESGGSLISSTTTVAIDPIDGTWAFLSGTQTYATTLSVFQDGAPLLGMIGNPATGEIGYAIANSTSRILQLSVFGEPEVAYTVREKDPSESPILVNLHPSRKAGPAMNALYKSWRERKISMVRSPGGSPSWALLEAAKGHFTYINLWSDSPAEPYDLAAGALVIWGAGGDVTDLAGRSISPLSHQGAFVAGTDENARTRIAAIVRDALS
jgi:myo-inositol-1(or 4)-monophosphatase